MEITIASVYSILCGILLGFAYRLVRDRLIVRMFPVQEARRRTKALKRGNFLDRTYLCNTGRAKVLTAWMENNPENPAAQALLRAETEVEIREQQEYEDELKRDREVRMAEAKRLEGRRLKWALENPTNDAAIRYLKKRLAELKADHDSEARTVEYLLSFYDSEEVEQATYQPKLEQARAELRRLEEFIYEIQLALGVDALDN